MTKVRVTLNPARGQLFFCFMATVTPLQKYPMSHPMSREMMNMWMDLHTPSAWGSSSKKTPFSSLEIEWWLSGKESFCQCRGLGLDPWDREIPWRRTRQPTPVSLPGKSHGQKSLVGYSARGRRELDMTEQLNKKKEQCSL